MKVFFRAAVAASALVLAIALASPAGAGVAEGKRAFEAGRCHSCHQASGPAAERSIHDQIEKKGPELWYAGSKFREGFLASWLADPRPIRHLAYNSLTEKNKGDHPRLQGREAADVADYLMSLKSADARALGIQPRENPRGRVMFVKKQSCYGCHTVNVRGKLVGGLSGPTLANASKRLSPDWIYSYLSNPGAFKPFKMMPVYSGILSEADMRELAEYVGSLR